MLPPVTSVVVLGLSALSGATSLRSRASVQSNATCGSEYSWMYNGQNLSPCWLASAVTGPCLQGDFNVGPLTPGNHYDPPTQAKSTVTRCLCSWAAYNLYSACTACQDQGASVLTWPAFRQECPDNFISNSTYWPSDIPILGNNTLPFYAGTNPSTWQDQRFNANQARNISNQQHADLTGQPTSTPTSNDSKSSAPVGAIAGGVVGGLAVIIGAALVFWWLRKKNRAPKSGGIQELDPSYHRHSLSETQTGHKPMPSTSVSYSGSIYPTTTSPPPATSGTPTLYTHNESAQSFSQFGSVSAYTTPHSPPPTRYVTSPAPTARTTLPAPAPEDIIQPFVFNSTQTPTVDTHSMDPVTPRKGDLVVLNGNQRIAGPAVNRDESDDEGQSSGNLNPPAYTAYPAPSETSSVVASRRENQGHGHRPHGQLSQDTTQSSFSSPSPWTSFGSGHGDGSMASSTIPFGVAAGEFGQLSTPPRPGMQQSNSSRRSVIGDRDDHVEIA
ncbi:hypothetical protein PM082_014065 [Marasmius tenuissimus]|nr:hypothetical protein PM082_014065 [Marasmius tenuissimus]